MNIVEVIDRTIKRIPLYFQQFKTLVRQEGLVKTLFKVLKKLWKFIISGGKASRLMRLNYQEWQKNIEATYLNEATMEKDAKAVGRDIKFSIIFPVWNKDRELLQLALNSITKQVYDNWELCISDGSSENVLETRRFLESFQKEYPNKVKLGFLDKTLREKINIVENSNNAINMATGEYIVFMDCDDELSPNCLLELAKSIKGNPDVEFLYSDFDKIDKKGTRFDPSFWPDFSPHTLTSQMYTTHVTCYRKNVIEELEKIKKGTEGAQDWDLVLRYVTRGNWKVIHIPKILYHWRVYPGSTALANSGAKSWAYENQKKVLEGYLVRRELSGSVLEGPFQGAWRVKFDIIDNPKISIVIPTKDKVEYIRRAVGSILEHTKYRNYEIVIVNNRSEEKETLEYFKEITEKENIKVIDFNSPFHFGKLYNWASKQVNGEYMLMLNNDIKVLNDGWLEAMLEFAQLPEVGGVGAKLYYGDGKIQHAGVIVGAGGAAAHSHRLLHGSTFGYEGCVVNIRNYLTLTAACLLINRKLFIDIGGFDEEFDPAYQDVDLGIRLYEKGFYNVYTPYAELTHYESVTRFDEKNKEKLESDESNALKLRKKWPQYIEYMGGQDPFYNPNLSYAHEDFRIRTR